MVIYGVGRDPGYILCRGGQKEEGIAMLKRSLAIGKTVQFPDVGVIEKILREVEKIRG